MKKVNFLLLAFLGLIFISCDPISHDNLEEEPQQNFVSTGFPVDVFKTIVNQDPKENVILSPLSIESAFLMAANGANGETRKNILDVLGQTEDISTINSNYKSLKSALDYQGDTTTFKMVNSVFWDENRIDVKDDFLKNMTKYYDAEQQNLDFADKKTVDIINKWVSDNTEERIKDILTNITGDDVLFLINALYFIGDWKFPFPVEGTFDNSFTKSDGTKIEVPFMNGEGFFDAFSNDDFQAVDLPFANTDFSMTFIMPKKQNIKDFINEFGLDDLEDLYKNKFFQLDVAIQLPKFELAYKIKLNKSLMTMGMNLPFDRDLADFSNLGSTGGPLFIGQAIHKTFLKVDEKGAEGAAVTVIGFVNTSVGGFLSFNKPFMVVLKNHKTDSYVFMAKIGEPKFDE